MGPEVKAKSLERAARQRPPLWVEGEMESIRRQRDT